MAMRALRDGASKGILKFFLLGLLALAAGGLVFTDVGGFFRGGSVGNSNVAKIGSETLSFQEFSNAISPVLRNIGMSPQEAYTRGYVKEFLVQKINDSVITQTANDLGIAVHDERAAQKVKELIAPEIATGIDPKQALSQRLRMMNMNQSQFLETLTNAMKTEPLITSLQNNSAVSNFVKDDIMSFQAEKRNIKLVTLKNNSVTTDKPDESNLITLYEMNKEEYATPETRTFNLIEIIYDAKSDELSEDEILEEKYALADIVDDLAASGATGQEIAEQTGSKLTTTKAISPQNTDIDEKIIKEGFNLEQGEISPVFETKDNKFMAVELTTLTEKSYKPFESVKDQIIKKWNSDQQKIENKIRALSLVGEINKGEKKLSSIGTIKTLNNLQRTDEPPAPLDANTLNAIFRAEKDKAVAFPTKDGMGIAIVTKTDLTAKLSDENQEKVIETLQQAAGNEALMLYLNNKRSAMTIKTNDGLLERTFGAAPQQ